MALAPDRGRSADRRADYHDPTLPPRHALLAFGLWLQQSLGCHALIHVGAHGTLEWLPGKTVALSESCFPEIVTGALPVIYPFIVSNPGEAAQAKRRIAAVTHRPSAAAARRAPGSTRASRARTAGRRICAGRRARPPPPRPAGEADRRDGAQRPAWPREAGVGGGDDPDAALRRIDAWLCDLKDFADQGRAARLRPHAPRRSRSAARGRAPRPSATRCSPRSTAATSPPGPSGAPARGRTDVLPTGRNLFTADPRTMPTPTAFELGQAAADEVLRRYVQDHGDWPRALVIDLWGSASLRTGGEEIAQGLALMGCRPQWDAATGRVTGIEVLPPAALGRPRVDVTLRISGLFRDMFPAQIALIDAAVGAVAARDEADGDNPLAAASRTSGQATAPRIFGSSPGTYGAGIEELLSSGNWDAREEIGRAFSTPTSHAYGGADGDGAAAPGRASPSGVARPIFSIHTGDDPGRDILEGSADVAFIGGFAAALAALGRNADLIALDTTDPARPRARSVGEAVARVVRARAVNPRFIEGQMRHGPRGASEFAETVDRLVGFAETTDAIPGALIEAVHDAYLGDAEVRAFMLRENPAARPRHRRALCRGAPAGPLASAAQLHRRRSRSADRRAQRAGDRGMNAPLAPRRLPGAFRADADRRRPARAALARGRLSVARSIDRAVRRRLSPWQRHRRGHGARQLADPRPDAGDGRRLAEDIAALGISPRTGIAVDTPALAGLDARETADPRPLALAIRQALAESGLAARLGPKVSVVVDGGGLGLGAGRGRHPPGGPPRHRWRSCRSCRPAPSPSAKSPPLKPRPR